MAAKAGSFVEKLAPLLNRGANLAKAQQPRLERFWAVAKVELAPPGPSEFPQIVKGFKQAISINRIADQSVKNVMLNATACFEIFLWYQIGRIVGKRSLVGFDIEGASSYPPIKKN
ncbi:ATP synthase subunit g, mitochondrial-like [Pecten maximus]|uniref:ATP synthase subunit g, mitochondrial-like n=1 Tax=Pecten maximus TaxID=6579 RepID=UPI00145830BB|nr:ATP synthase subunit g, mitochondrial-like [Pecten maximus]